MESPKKLFRLIWFTIIAESSTMVCVLKAAALASFVDDSNRHFLCRDGHPGVCQDRCWLIELVLF